MSTGEMENVREYMDIQVKKSQWIPRLHHYPIMQKNVLEARRKYLNKQRKQMAKLKFDVEKRVVSTERKNGSPGDGSELEALKKGMFERRTERKARDYFFDYNTVESTLLACAILICLTGIMFESERLQRKDEATITQKNFLTYTILIIIFGSLFYYFTVCFAEICALNGSNWLLRFLMQVNNKDQITQEDMDQGLEVATNPFHLRKHNQTEDSHKLLEAKLAKERRKNKALEDRMVEEEKKSGGGKLATGMRNLVSVGSWNADTEKRKTKKVTLEGALAKLNGSPNPSLGTRPKEALPNRQLPNRQLPDIFARKGKMGRKTMSGVPSKIKRGRVHQRALGVQQTG